MRETTHTLLARHATTNGFATTDEKRAHLHAMIEALSVQGVDTVYELLCWTLLPAGTPRYPPETDMPCMHP